VTINGTLVAYACLILAIAIEVVGTSLLKSTHGFTRLGPSLSVIAAYAISTALLAKVVEKLPVGITYAVWSGTGTVIVVAIGVLVLGESLSLLKIVGIGLVVSGVVVLNLGGAH
jgi:small multidrug resistance pump